MLQICLWDLRNKKAVVEYIGNNNLYTKLPVHVDGRERIIYSGKRIVYSVALVREHRHCCKVLRYVLDIFFKFCKDIMSRDMTKPTK